METLFDKKYRYIKDLGNGGFGKVFLAKEELTGQFVAIKQLKAADKNGQDLLIHEMQMVSRFNHTHIINYRHYFFKEDILYFVMEYCSNGSLRKLMSDPKLVTTFVWKWMAILTETLSYVHSKGIVHHDIKPENILFTENRILKISDFGAANTHIGTFSYLSPESWLGFPANKPDPRNDIYSLGVTLLELLTSQNPFKGKMPDLILKAHQNKDYGIEQLSIWQQEIITKAISPVPESRFQTMSEFYEAVVSKTVPLFFDADSIKAGEIASRSQQLIMRKKWSQAISILDYAEQKYKPSVNIMLQKGRYFLRMGEIELAKKYFDKALIWNSRLNIQKELGWINLEIKNYSKAISYLSDHLHRNPEDYEAFNLLAECYYQTNRFELAIELLSILHNIDKKNKCFANNLYVCGIMYDSAKFSHPETMLKADQIDNYFFEYNYGLVNERKLSHNFDHPPFLKSKLLFMDYRFKDYSKSKLYISFDFGLGKQEKIFEKALIKIGRNGFSVNDVEVPGNGNISRRQCVLVNYRNDIWLYDLASTGTFLNGFHVIDKTPLLGRNIIKVGDFNLEITNEPDKLL